VTDVDLGRASDFVWRSARLIDRLLYERRFEGKSAEDVVHALPPTRTTTAASATRSSPTCAGR